MSIVRVRSPSPIFFCSILFAVDGAHVHEVDEDQLQSHVGYKLPGQTSDLSFFIVVTVLRSSYLGSVRLSPPGIVDPTRFHCIPLKDDEVN